jgi:hypothetical protein
MVYWAGENICVSSAVDCFDCRYIKMSYFIEDSPLCRYKRKKESYFEISPTAQTA